MTELLTLAQTAPADLGGWLHDLNRVAIPLPGPLEPFSPKWYGLSYIAGFVVAYLLLRTLARRGAVLIPADRVLDAMLLIVLGVFIGGRLGYVVFYQPSLFVEFTADPPFWSVFAINRGGMASHGGMIGVALACARIARGFKDPDTGLRPPPVPRLHVMDAVCLAAPPGLFFGRIANFVNGELLGRIVAHPGEPAPWWAVRYPQELLERRRQWLDAAEPETVARLIRLQDRYLLPGDAVDADGFSAAAIARMIEALQAGADTLAAASLRQELEPLLTARAPSQLLQALAEGAVVMAAVWFVARRPRRPGVIGCWFLIVYGVGRVLTEFVRLPDTHFGDAARILGLSRGQWLSAAMVVAGAAILYLLTRRDTPKLGGWLRHATNSQPAPPDAAPPAPPAPPAS